MGNKLLLLKEYFQMCPNGVCDRNLLTESDREYVSQGGLILTGICQRGGVRNGNNRVYPKHLLEREMEKYRQLISSNMAYGELDHSDSEVPLLKNSSHRMIDYYWKGDDLVGKFKVNNTSNGKTVQELVADGGQLGISSRALGSLTESANGSVVNEDLQIIAFDLVSVPSTAEAYVRPMALNESQIRNIQTKLNSNYSKIDYYCRLILGK